jgi:hypothetical protein
MLPMQKRPLSCGTGAGGDLLTQLGGLLVPRRLFAGALLCGLAFPFGLLLFGSLLGAQFFYVSAVRLALDRRADSCARRR